MAVSNLTKKQGRPLLQFRTYCFVFCNVFFFLLFSYSCSCDIEYLDYLLISKKVWFSAHMLH